MLTNIIFIDEHAYPKILIFKRGIHKLRWQARGRGGLAKCQRYYISLCSKLVNEGGGAKNPQNIVNVVYECPLISFDFPGKILRFTWDPLVERSLRMRSKSMKRKYWIMTSMSNHIFIYIRCLTIMVFDRMMMISKRSLTSYDDLRTRMYIRK